MSDTANLDLEVVFCKMLADMGYLPLSTYEANVETYKLNPAYAAFIEKLFTYHNGNTKHPDFGTIAMQGPSVVIGLPDYAVKMAKDVGLIATKSEAKPKHWSAILLATLMPIGYRAMDSYLSEHRAELEAKLPELTKFHTSSLADIVASTGKPNPGASCEVQIKGFVIPEVKPNRKGTALNVTRKAAKQGTDGAVERTCTLFLGFRNDLIRPTPLTGKALADYEAAVKAGDTSAALAATESTEETDDEEASGEVAEA